MFIETFAVGPLQCNCTVLADDEVHTFCDRVGTDKWKKGYDLAYGWDGAFRKYQELALDAISDRQHEILSTYN